MKEQTAVEFMYNELGKLNIMTYSKNTEISVIKIFKQAKEMEKEKIKNAWMDGKYLFKHSSSEQYYNETYETKEN
jgi:hypothetical protein